MIQLESENQRWFNNRIQRIRRASCLSNEIKAIHQKKGRLKVVVLRTKDGEDMKWVKSGGHFVLALNLAPFVGCAKSADSFSVLPDQIELKQESEVPAPKLDVLWVIDNSGSMSSSQARLAQNFRRFIQRFVTTNQDYHLAITTTDAYFSRYKNKPHISRFVPFYSEEISPASVMIEKFSQAVQVGISGSNDERAFQSFREGLENPMNKGFHRSDAHLAIVIVSDEDDFSHVDWLNGISSYYKTESYQDPHLISIADYIHFLTVELAPNHPDPVSVSAISIKDKECLNELNQQNPGRKLGRRYLSLVQATGGAFFSLCEDFSSSLVALAAKLEAKSQRIYFKRRPIPESIRVFVNDIELQRDSEQGWTYDPETNAVCFHGKGIPPRNASIRIPFQPIGVRD